MSGRSGIVEPLEDLGGTVGRPVLYSAESRSIDRLRVGGRPASAMAEVGPVLVRGLRAGPFVAHAAARARSGQALGTSTMTAVP